MNEARVYEVTDKENFVIRYKEARPLSSVNGFYCFSQYEMASLKKWIIDNQKQCRAKVSEEEFEHVDF